MFDQVVMIKSNYYCRVKVLDKWVSWAPGETNGNYFTMSFNQIEWLEDKIDSNQFIEVDRIPHTDKEHFKNYTKYQEEVSNA